TEFQPSRVYKDGALVARDGVVAASAVPRPRETHRVERVSISASATRSAPRAPLPRSPSPLSASVNPPHLTTDALRIGTAGLQADGPTNEGAARAGAEAGKVRCIVALENKIITRTVLLTPTVADGAIVADPARDILKLVCAERHGRNGRVGVGLVSGFGLVRGALASSVGHDHHNLMVLGAADDDMLTAIEHLRGTGGGLVVVDGGRVVADLPLPLAGLITPEPLEPVREALDALDEAAAALGNRMPSPFMTLSFLGLPVIPSLRLTDMGLVDVEAGRLVSLVA